MPHITIEHSPNVAERTDVGALVRHVHERVLSLGLLPAERLRTRAFAPDHAIVGDGDPSRGYVAVFARLASGRTPEQKAAMVDLLRRAVEEHLGAAVAGLLVSAEYIEVDAADREDVLHP
jgi:5-carboxymethyl-2-hydroxymuconate isomerase